MTDAATAHLPRCIRVKDWPEERDTSTYQDIDHAQRVIRMADPGYFERGPYKTAPEEIARRRTAAFLDGAQILKRIQASRRECLSMVALWTVVQTPSSAGLIESDKKRLRELSQLRRDLTAALEYLLPWALTSAREHERAARNLRKALKAVEL